MTVERVEIFTDGACSGNPGPGGWAALLRFRGIERWMNGAEPATTNNRMELIAALPGVVRLNDANLLMFRHVLAAVDANAAKQVFESSRKLHQATTVDREQTFAAARALRERLMALRETTKATEFPAESLGVILGSLVADAERGEFRDYAAAEQAAMAVQSVVVAYEGAGLLDEAAAKRMQERVDALYASIEKDESWSMTKFTEALRAARAAAP